MFELVFVTIYNIVSIPVFSVLSSVMSLFSSLDHMLMVSTIYLYTSLCLILSADPVSVAILKSSYAFAEILLGVRSDSASSIPKFAKNSRFASALFADTITDVEAELQALSVSQPFAVMVINPVGKIMLTTPSSVSASTVITCPDNV
jgi:hypothetical protein